MKRAWYIRHERKESVSSCQEDQCSRAFRGFARTPSLSRLRGLLHYGQYQALQLARNTKLVLAATTAQSSVHVQLLEQQVRQEEFRTPRPRPLVLRPAAAHLAPPA